MNDSTRIFRLVESLGREVSAARAGSDQGQFPILDLAGNLRDEAAKNPALEEMRLCCAEAWERLVRIVESGHGFQPDEIQWLQDLLAKVSSWIAGAAPTAQPAEAPPPPQPAPVPEAVSPPPAPAAAPAPAIEEEAPLELNIESDGDLLREFINESREHLDNIEQGVLVLEHRPTDAETLNTVFRAFHTFKGGAGFLNLIPINRLAHVLESLLDLARQDKLVITESVINLILRGRDVLKQFVDEIDGQLNGSRPLTPIQIPIVGLKRTVQAAIENASGIPPAADIPGVTRQESATDLAQLEKAQLPPPASWLRLTPKVPAALNGLCYTASAGRAWGFLGRTEDRAQWFLVTGQPDGPPTRVGSPKGPARSARWSPTSRDASLRVVLPTTMKMKLTVPASASQSENVRGILSPQASTRSTRNWPAWTFAAMSGDWTVISKTASESRRLVTMRKRTSDRVSSRRGERSTSIAFRP